MLTLLLFNKQKHNPTSMYYWLMAELITLDVPVFAWLVSILPLGAWLLIAVAFIGCWWLIYGKWI